MQLLALIFRSRSLQGASWDDRALSTWARSGLEKPLFERSRFFNEERCGSASHRPFKAYLVRVDTLDSVKCVSWDIFGACEGMA